MRTYIVYPMVLCLIGFVGCGQDKGADKSQEGTSQNEVALDAVSYTHLTLPTSR